MKFGGGDPLFSVPFASEHDGFPSAALYPPLRVSCYGTVGVLGPHQPGSSLSTLTVKEADGAPTNSVKLRK